MLCNAHKHRHSLFTRILSFIIILSFCLGLITPPAYAQMGFILPTPGTMVMPSAAYTPAYMLGMTLNPENPLELNFIIDRGDDALEGDALEEESQKLLSYFYATMTVPEDEMWVNLSPYEENRIIADGLGNTVLGRDMLAQDYMLKQLSASIAYPEEEMGKQFWARVHQRVKDEFGAAEIPMNTFNKIWIVPDSARIYTHENSVFIVENYLKVMLEEDYLALEHNSEQMSTGDPMTGVTNEVVREILIPEIEMEVNYGKNFAPLRQMFHSMILATWYKQNLRSSILTQSIANQNKTDGINVDDPAVVQEIYDQYVEAFKVGVYDYIKEEMDTATNEMIPRKYFSGGVDAEITFDRAMIIPQSKRESLEGRQFVEVATSTSLMSPTGQAILDSQDFAAQLAAQLQESLDKRFARQRSRLNQLQRNITTAMEFINSERSDTARTSFGESFVVYESWIKALNAQMVQDQDYNAQSTAEIEASAIVAFDLSRDVLRELALARDGNNENLFDVLPQANNIEVIINGLANDVFDAAMGTFEEEFKAALAVKFPAKQAYVVEREQENLFELDNSLDQSVVLFYRPRATDDPNYINELLDTINQDAAMNVNLEQFRNQAMYVRNEIIEGLKFVGKPLLIVGLPIFGLIYINENMVSNRYTDGILEVVNNSTFQELPVLDFYNLTQALEQKNRDEIFARDYEQLARYVGTIYNSGLVSPEVMTKQYFYFIPSSVMEYLFDDDFNVMNIQTFTELLVNEGLKREDFEFMVSRDAQDDSFGVSSSEPRLNKLYKVAEWALENYNFSDAAMTESEETIDRYMTRISELSELIEQKNNQISSLFPDTYSPQYQELEMKRNRYIQEEKNLFDAIRREEKMSPGLDLTDREKSQDAIDVLHDIQLSDDQSYIRVTLPGKNLPVALEIRIEQYLQDIAVKELNIAEFVEYGYDEKDSIFIQLRDNLESKEEAYNNLIKRLQSEADAAMTHPQNILNQFRNRNYLKLLREDFFKTYKRTRQTKTFLNNVILSIAELGYETNPPTRNDVRGVIFGALVMINGIESGYDFTADSALEFIRGVAIEYKQKQEEPENSYYLERINIGALVSQMVRKKLVEGSEAIDSMIDLSRTDAAMLWETDVASNYGAIAIMSENLYDGLDQEFQVVIDRTVVPIGYIPTLSGRLTYIYDLGKQFLDEYRTSELSIDLAADERLDGADRGYIRSNSQALRVSNMTFLGRVIQIASAVQFRLDNPSSTEFDPAMNATRLTRLFLNDRDRLMSRLEETKEDFNNYMLSRIDGWIAFVRLSEEDKFDTAGKISDVADKLYDRKSEAVNDLENVMAETFTDVFGTSDSAMANVETSVGFLISDLREYQQENSSYSLNVNKVMELVDPLATFYQTEMKDFPEPLWVALASVNQSISAFLRDSTMEKAQKEAAIREALENTRSALESSELVDSAMTDKSSERLSEISPEYGGIDFNAGNLNLSGDGEPIQFNFPPLDFNPAEINGVLPVILNVTPITNLPMLLGLKPEDELQELSRL